MKRSFVGIIADKYLPVIRRDSGALDSDYHNRQCRRALRRLLREASCIARNPYGDAVRVIGAEEPLVVGNKIAAAIETLGTAKNR